MQENRNFYRERPFVFLAIGLLAIYYSPKNILAFVSSSLLIMTSLMIFYMRNTYQKKISELENKLAIENKMNSSEIQIK